MNNLFDNAFYATRKGYEILEKEYYSITDEYKATTRAMGKSDEMDSDLRENPEFMELRVKAMYELPNKKRQLFERMKNCIIIEEMEEYKNFDETKVIRGCTVDLKIDEEIETYTILGTSEGNLEKNILSESAPIVRAILGKNVGNTVQFNDSIIQILAVKKFEL